MSTWEHRSSSACNSANSVFIQNLDKSIDKETLNDICSVFGRILRCEISHDKKSSKITYGFVGYDSEDSANACIQALNGMELLDRKITVKKSTSVAAQQQDKMSCNLYVKNFGEELTTESLKELFGKFGAIKNHRVVIDKKSGKSCGHGFVVFENSSSAARAIQELNGWKLANGKQLQVGSAVNKPQDNPVKHHDPNGIQFRQGFNLHVNNLDASISDKGLREMFKPYGNVISTRVMQGPNGKSKEYGFVCFSKVDEALVALLQMNGKRVGTKALHVSMAQCKKDREPMAQCVQQLANMAMCGASPPNPWLPLVYSTGMSKCDDQKKKNGTNKQNNEKDEEKAVKVLPGFPGMAAM
ncbi:polyadenylate-binding protein 1-like [Malaya genurostris]|uniref:polyadenylate-binding protein 1-like n=1 Tax=Malaya genurostris TaxID=325434 RepID=UPI0026F3F4A4|nr:polyadenylate-binding protein 1-like [Malaya genurostris]